VKFQYDENEVKRIAHLYHIKELSLFGSAVRDAFNKDSDVDLLVVFEDNADLSRENNFGCAQNIFRDAVSAENIRFDSF